MDSEDGFDPTLMKKKKKKKITFADDEPKGDTKDEKYAEDTPIIDDDNLDLESFGKKKTKKKKAFNLTELEGALPTAPSGGDDSSALLTEAVEDPDIDLDIDFSMTKKKKKSKKKDLEELVADKTEDDANEDKENFEEKISSWADTDRDYTYDELLKRIFDTINDKNPEMAAGRRTKVFMRPPHVLRVGTKKTSFANFMEIAKTLHRQPKHLLDFLLAELGTSGSMDGNQQLIIKGRFQPKQIENVLRRYVKEYVTCHTCKSAETILQKKTRIFFLQCETCHSCSSVASIKSGFQAVTGKRAAIRAKTT